MVKTTSFDFGLVVSLHKNMFYKLDWGNRPLCMLYIINIPFLEYERCFNPLPSDSRVHYQHNLIYMLNIFTRFSKKL